jgi:Flp pilus assembly protein TadG
VPSRRLQPFRSERGQAAVEFALVAPIVIALLLGIVQGGIAFSHYLTITDAARAGARAAVVSRFDAATPASIRQVVVDAAGGLDASELGVTIADPGDPTFTHSGSTLSVTVTYPYSIDILGWAISSGNLTSTMTERLE